MAETVIRPALPAQDLATDLIDEHHEHLQLARILWLFTTSKRTRGGHVVLGSSSRSNPLQRYLSSGNESVQTGYDYIVLLDEGRWLRAIQTQRLALVDHLCCCMVQKETRNNRTGEITKTWGTVGPDISEFTAVVRRHGVYLPAQQQFAKVLRELGSTMRLAFPDIEADEKEKPARKVVAAVLEGSNGETPRETTVDGEGTVVATKRGRGRPPKKTLPEPEATPASSGEDDKAYRADWEPPDGYLPPELEDAVLEQTNGHADAPVPSDEAEVQPWEVVTGVGQNDLARHRAARAASSSAS